MNLSPPDPVYLIIFGAQGSASRPTRTVRHIGIERTVDGETNTVPRCNAHYMASHDMGPRQFREVEGVEQAYPICKRCLNWRPYPWVK